MHFRTFPIAARSQTLAKWLNVVQAAQAAAKQHHANAVPADAVLPAFGSPGKLANSFSTLYMLPYSEPQSARPLPPLTLPVHKAEALPMIHASA